MGVFVAATLHLCQTMAVLDSRKGVRRNGSSSLGVAIHLRHDNGTEICAFLERTSLCLSSLT